MPNFKLKIKRGAAAPAVGTLDIGELGYNTTDKILYVGNGTDQAATPILPASSVVRSLSFGTTGLAPSTATTGVITVTGTLVTANGGTGLTTYTKGDILYQNESTTSLAKLGIGSTNQILTVGAGGVPAWADVSAPLTDDILDGSANKYTPYGTATAGKLSSVTPTAGQTILGYSGYFYANRLFDNSNRVVAQIETTGAGNAVTSVSKTDDTITFTKGSTFLTSQTSSKNIVGASGTATANAAVATNGVYLNHLEDTTVISKHQIIGAGGATVTSDAGGNITITQINTATHADGIMDGSNTGTEVSYTPYATQQAKLSFDTSATAPTRTDRLNLNGYLYATKVYSGGTEVLTAHPTITTTTDTTSTASPAHGGTFTAIDGVTRDANGHVTTLNTKTITLPADLDTKNTAGSTDTASKIYLVGATSQAANPQTYSDDEVYVTSGALNAKSLTLSDDLTVNGGDIISTSESFNLLNTNIAAGTVGAPKTIAVDLFDGTVGNYVTKNVNIATGANGATNSVTNINLGNSTSTVSIPGNLIVSGTVSTNNVEMINTANGVIFEGTTNDGFETTLTAINPTADNAIQLPNASGTVALTSDIGNGTLTVTAGDYLTFGSGDGTFSANQSGNEAWTINHDATTRTDTTSTASPAHSGTFTAVDSITTNTTGHITAINLKTITLPALTLVAHALSNHTDVSITSADANDLLSFNGTNWVNVEELDCGAYAV